MKIFVSYSHRQAEWVVDRLLPCLIAGGADVLIDRERFEGGKSLTGQMDTVQDQADTSLIVLSPDYLESAACRHEMERAISSDPTFSEGRVVPLMRVSSSLPEILRKADPLYADLRDDRNADAWQLILSACKASLGTTAPFWLDARDELRRLLARWQSVNFVTYREVRWRALVEHLRQDQSAGFGVVDLERGATVSRAGLVAAILEATGGHAHVPEEPRDLAELERVLTAKRRTRIALLHFDMVVHRSHYGVDLFAALRNLMMDERKLTLLVQSRTPFAALMPRDHPLSMIDLHTVELKGAG